MKISCVQMDMAFGKPQDNFSLAQQLVQQAVEKDHPDVVVLPETWNTGFSPKDINPGWADQDCTKTKAVFSRLAETLNTNIIAGSVTNARGGKLYNTAMAFNRRGTCVASYDKTHLFSPMGEERVYEKGASLCRFQLDGGNCGLIICYDLRFPELIRSLTLPGLDVLFVVSQWPLVRKAHLMTLTRARAIENQMFVALCNSCGKAGATVYGGCSAIVDPWGEPLAQASTGPCTITADADFSMLTEIRGTIPVFQDRRPELYSID